MDAFADQAQSPEETELAGAFRAFNWRAFKEKARTLRIVARSDIEHWLARNRANLGKDADAAREELLRRHGFGNLALINESDNSSLGDWFDNTHKLPQGLRHLSDEIHALGLKFGLWVEPEMILRTASFTALIRIGASTQVTACASNRVISSSSI